MIRSLRFAIRMHRRHCPLYSSVWKTHPRRKCAGYPATQRNRSLTGDGLGVFTSPHKGSPNTHLAGADPDVEQDFAEDQQS